MNSSTLTKYAPHALSVLRIVAALLFIEHGTQKLFGFPATQMQVGSWLSLFGLAGFIEVFGGLLLLVGFFTRPLAFLMAGEMAYAYWAMHVPMGGLFPVNNGGDAAVLFCFVFLYLVFAGPGAWSVDAARGKANWAPAGAQGKTA